MDFTMAVSKGNCGGLIVVEARKIDKGVLSWIVGRIPVHIDGKITPVDQVGSHVHEHPEPGGAQRRPIFPSSHLDRIEIGIKGITRRIGPAPGASSEPSEIVIHDHTANTWPRDPVYHHKGFVRRTFVNGCIAAGVWK